VKVLQDSFVNLKYNHYKYEIYAKHVGLIKKVYINLENKDNMSGEIKNGVKYEWRLIDYGKNKLFLLIITIVFASTMYAQIYYRVDFTNKYNTNFSLDHPEEYLSARAIDRRTKFNIQIDSTDLPVNSWYLDSLRNLGCEIVHSSRWFNSAVIKINDSNLVNTITQLSCVRNVQLVKPIVNKDANNDKKHPHNISIM